MKPLLLLVAVFGLSLVVSKIATGYWNVTFSGNLAMFIMLCFTGMAHFKFTEGMVLMIPGIIPFKKELVYVTGIAEILPGLALLFPQYRYYAGILLIMLLVLMLPANIHAAFKHVNYETAGFDGSGPSYLWLRVPLQVFFIAWIFYFSVKN